MSKEATLAHYLEQLRLAQDDWINSPVGQIALQGFREKVLQSEADVLQLDSNNEVKDEYGKKD
jgi:hypothetical protein